jgi:hypothetical protein
MKVSLSKFNNAYNLNNIPLLLLVMPRGKNFFRMFESGHRNVFNSRQLKGRKTPAPIHVQKDEQLKV